jgi:pimeloyl-ACP methyl ester carboxylesterase
MLLLALLLSQAQVGDYLGSLQVNPSISLRLGLHIVKDDSGAWKGTVDSLDQGARGIPVQLTIEGKSVRFGSAIGMSYEGALTDTGIAGFFSQGGARIPLDFKKVDRIEEARRPQTPKRPFPYTEEEVAVQSGPIKLGGTLTLPKGDGPFPAVIFLTGSGAQDRDETIFEHKPFLVISDHLTRNGFATLRLDDRGVGKSGGVLPNSTLDDLAGDAGAALEYLKTRKEIQAKRIGFLGHSEGGITGPLAAVRTGEAAFVILLAGTGVPGDELLYEQGQLGLKASGADAATLAFQTKFHKTFLPLVKTEKDNAVLAPKVLEAWRKMKADDPLAAAADKQIAPQLQMLLMPAMQSLIRHDPRPVLSELTCPVLALNGTLDTQVSAEQNLPSIAQALAKGKHPDYTVVSLRHLNHLFQTAKSGAVGEYGQIEETLAPQVLDVITAWLKSKTN